MHCSAGLYKLFVCVVMHQGYNNLHNIYIITHKIQAISILLTHFEVFKLMRSVRQFDIENIWIQDEQYFRQPCASRCRVCYLWGLFCLAFYRRDCLQLGLTPSCCKWLRPLVKVFFLSSFR